MMISNYIAVINVKTLMTSAASNFIYNISTTSCYLYLLCKQSFIGQVGNWMCIISSSIVHTVLVQSGPCTNALWPEDNIGTGIHIWVGKTIETGYRLQISVYETFKYFLSMYSLYFNGEMCLRMVCIFLIQLSPLIKIAWSCFPKGTDVLRIIHL